MAIVLRAPAMPGGDLPSSSTGRLRHGLTRGGRVVVASTLVASSLVLMSSCSDAHPALQFRVDHIASNVDGPLRVVVSHAPKDGEVSVALTATDVAGVTWRSSALFRAVDGEVDLTTAMPLSGSYAGVDPMGLFWSMKPVSGSRNDAYFAYGPSGFTATLQASTSGRAVSAVRLTRRAQGPDVVVADERPTGTGFYGEYYRPHVANAPRPAIVVIGGSEGGLAVDGLAKLLASDGYPTLALAYFNEPGLPGAIQNIPLEYFTSAIAWLKKQPDVDPAQVNLLGISRGAEAALLVAADFPGVVHAVIAAAPTSVVNPPEPGPRGAAWTLRGRQIHGVSVKEFGQPDPPSDQTALIRVGNFSGRMMLICGTSDTVWPSCDYATTIEREREAAGRGGDVVLRAQGAGHGVASLVPYISEASTNGMGGDPGADGRARAHAWTALLRFLGGAA